MLSLLDLGPMTEEVTIRGQKITVHAITPECFFVLFQSFPELRKMAAVQDPGASAIMQIAPGAVNLIIAMSTVDRDQFQTVKDYMEVVRGELPAAARLGIQHKLAVIGACVRVTFPEGLGPFLQDLNALTGSIKEVRGQTDSASDSPRRSRTGFTTDSRGLRLGRAAHPANSMH